ncbi:MULTISPECIES: hypothetical protein [unclassified Herbaspirillum]|uniref:hypothetical protein n=1 Tax=unclassified Herbaspirillum TaxID=2624150 RepID=UPI001173D72E|nr:MULTISPECIES: hypothetical protein [unclassified Herbaspirillum]MBB5391303.1 hypothetical protein [Herbaspirillum sp. SJZ102]TQK13010.1 hypothetical protein FB599_0417 [Herbaspirillum sp. SJZ130]TQK15014.1 hypothetical protein FB598_0355 [Herbaspirillum sp. SJZ106]TWC67370.1 hypothetical protein FB597_104180 [Herbaspirillum sp. SJZ099]
MINKFIAIVSPLLLVTACANAPVASLMPLEDGSYRSLAYSESEQQALGSSLKLAETTCRERNLRHAIVNADTRYRGLPLRRTEPQETAAELAAYVNSPRFPALDANDDYEVKVLFKCV